MEHAERHLARKRAELRLIAGEDPRVPVPAHAIPTEKFRAAAELKARRIAGTWQLTETHWSAAPDRPGLHYAYQRADLETGFPRPYDAAVIERTHRVLWSGYVSCGMAALAMLAAALGRVRPGARIALPPACYGETEELLARYGAALGLAPAADGGASIRLVDSGAGSAGVEAQASGLGGTELVVFDTTCLAAGSGRIAAVLRRARHLPVALVRSHTKLDSLGVEYGRIGSIALLAPRAGEAPACDALVPEVHDAVRLFGAAPVPAHVPPFAGSADWRALSRARLANIVRNNRRAARALAASAPPGWTVRCYPHGLFAVLGSDPGWTEDEARARSCALAATAQHAGLPLRQAGSFGFDFAVTDAFPAPSGDRFILRLAMGDLQADSAGELIGHVATRLQSP